MPSSEALYLGFDLSTQQLKCLAVNSDLKLKQSAIVDFDQDFGLKYGVSKGVLTNPQEGEIYAPTAMWLEAIDLVLQRLKDSGVDMGAVRAVSGAGMQHGIVLWHDKAETLLKGLDGNQSLIDQLGGDPNWDGQGEGHGGAFAHPHSPNWQDASTEQQCEQFDSYLPGKQQALAETTGSKAHHRFSGPQIMRFKQKYPSHYEQTARISLVSSFITTVLLGKYAPVDIGDVCGMNLWHIKKGAWHDGLCELAAGKDNARSLQEKLGQVYEDGGGSLGDISSYFVNRYGFAKDCQVAPGTGDNPSTILALPLRAGDAIVSLGTSTTFLMSTQEYKPDPSYHFMNHPTTAGLHMFMLCYKNGALARERVRDAINNQLHSSNIDADMSAQGPWAMYNEVVTSTAPLGSSDTTERMKLGLYFPRHEIVPDIPAGEWRFVFNPSENHLTDTGSKIPWNIPHDDARVNIESQLLSLRLRSQNLVSSSKADNGKTYPAQPRRIYLVGGGSVNPAIAQVCGEVLGGIEGVYRLDIGGNACALGAAYKAVWAIERKVHAQENQQDIRGGRDTEPFEEFIAARWNEAGFVKKVDRGYREGVWETYGKALPGFAAMEQAVLEEVQQVRALNKQLHKKTSIEMGTTLTRERDLGVGMG